MSLRILIALNFAAVATLFFLRNRRRPFRILDPAWAFLGGYFMNYCVRPAVYLFDPDAASFYKETLNTDSALRAGLPGALLFAMIGFLGFAVGDLYCQRMAWSVSRCLPTADLGRLAKSRSYLTAKLLLGAAGVLGLWGFIHDTGWSGSVLELLTGFQRDTFLGVIFGHGYWTFAMQLSIVGWALMCAQWIAYPNAWRGWRRVAFAMWRYAWLIISVLVWVAFGERSAILTVIFVPFAIFVTVKSLGTNKVGQNILPRRAWILALLFMIIAGPVGLLMKQKEVTTSAIVGMAISAWDSMEFTVAANDQLGFRDLFWGRSYVSDILYTWYPRTLFPNKPERYGAVLLQDRLAPDLMEFPNATFPPGILVEAYANFWYVGLFVVPLLLAVFCRAVYFRIQARDVFWIVQMALFFPQLASFRSLGWEFAALFANLLVLALVIVLCRVASFLAFSPLPGPLRTREAQPNPGY
ncbi:MAG TPA: hypothetical protein VJX70_04315 [Candidatus Acidoferrum sp.]|nr:hypothetical protein [Candidatus Acidoferrum sp.]